MDAWWNRLMTKFRSDDDSHAMPMQNSTAALVARHTKSASAPHHTEVGGIRAWLSTMGARPDALRGDIANLADRLDRLCDVLERHMTSQDTRADDLARTLRKVAQDVSYVPASAAEQARHLTQLRDMIAQHRDDSKQLSEAMRDVPVSLRRNIEVIENHQRTVSEHGESLSELVTRARAAEQRNIDTAGKVDTVEASQHEINAVIDAVQQHVEMLAESDKTQANAITTLLREHRDHGHVMQETMEKQSRRFMLMTGFAVGAAATGAAFGAIQLFLYLIA